jgi:hypothetical protein
MRYETKPEFIRPPTRRVRKTFSTTKEEEHQSYGEHPSIYNIKTHTRKTIFKQPMTHAQMGHSLGGGLDVMSLLPLMRFVL